MDSASLPPAGGQSLTVPRHQGKKGRLLIAVVIILGLGVLIIVMVSDLPKRDVVLMTRAEGEPKPSKLDKARKIVARLLNPLLRRIRGPQPNVLIASKIIVLARNEALQSLGPATATNADSNEAWLLSSDRLNAFEQMLLTNSDFVTSSVPKLMTTDGMETKFEMGSSIPIS